LVSLVPDRSTVRLDDSVADRQPEAGALPYRLRGEERLKELRLVFRRHARTIVVDLEAYFLADVEESDQDAAFHPADSLDRLLGVDDEVERHLFELGEVRVHLARARRLDVERDRRGVEVAPPKLHHLADDVTKIDERGRAR